MKEKRTIPAQVIILIILIGVTLLFTAKESDLRNFLVTSIAGFGSAIVIAVVVWFSVNSKHFKYALLINLPWTFYKPVRITVAYLFRIRVDANYLLVRNSRNIDGFQPVGGVYKYLHTETAKFFDKIGLIPDNNIKRDEVGEYDLRMKLLKRNRLLSFIRWFDKQEGREMDPWREFQEELVKTGIISHANFPHIQYRKVDQITEYAFSKHHKIMELKIAEIYELQFTNDDQKREIRQLMCTGHEDILVATDEDIINMQKDEFTILEHTKKII